MNQQACGALGPWRETRKTASSQPKRRRAKCNRPEGHIAKTGIPTHRQYDRWAAVVDEWSNDEVTG